MWLISFSLAKVGNLPAEVAHLYEEMNAKDKKVAELRAIIASKDASIQRFIKTNGSNVPYPKEVAYSNIINQSFAEAKAIQEEKCVLAKKAQALVSAISSMHLYNFKMFAHERLGFNSTIFGLFIAYCF